MSALEDNIAKLLQQNAALSEQLSTGLAEVRTGQLELKASLDDHKIKTDARISDLELTVSGVRAELQESSETLKSESSILQQASPPEVEENSKSFISVITLAPKVFSGILEAKNIDREIVLEVGGWLGQTVVPQYVLCWYPIMIPRCH